MPCLLPRGSLLGHAGGGCLSLSGGG
ncbi:hypothetical protein E2C01_061450 [Portunus trituberculatus]|uniref:Uncharacterized protein n=1 Tax=Portunus trituberculatus TaxID=210409 RepID=A0A5B7HD77_PORTR|nr:hypothetical protein [Portunus trituberculatus]